MASFRFFRRKNSRRKAQNETFFATTVKTMNNNAQRTHATALSAGLLLLVRFFNFLKKRSKKQKVRSEQFERFRILHVVTDFIPV
jgi:hypothetical protein